MSCHVVDMDRRIGGRLRRRRHLWLLLQFCHRSRSSPRRRCIHHFPQILRTAYGGAQALAVVVAAKTKTKHSPPSSLYSSACCCQSKNVFSLLQRISFLPIARLQRRQLRRSEHGPTQTNHVHTFPGGGARRVENAQTRNGGPGPVVIQTRSGGTVVRWTLDLSAMAHQ